MVGAYLRFFTTALRRKFPRLWYVDAFAGTGHRTVRLGAQPGDLIRPPQVERVEQRRGSARIAIETQPGFDRLVFIERKWRHCEALEELRALHPDRNIEIRNQDGNRAVREVLQQGHWPSTRAVLFLDPYGMHVDWETLEAIRATEAVDLWYFVSLSGLFRQAALDEAKVTPEKGGALTRMLGTSDWREAWYASSPQSDLFGAGPLTGSRESGVDAIENFVHRRLTGLFSKVLPPRRFHNHRNTPMFSLFFAVSNPDPKAIGLSTKIASYILNSGRASHVLPL